MDQDKGTEETKVASHGGITEVSRTSVIKWKDTSSGHRDPKTFSNQKSRITANNTLSDICTGSNCGTASFALPLELHFQNMRDKSGLDPRHPDRNLYHRRSKNCKSGCPSIRWEELVEKSGSKGDKGWKHKEYMETKIKLHRDIKFYLQEKEAELKQSQETDATGLGEVSHGTDKSKNDTVDDEGWDHVSNGSS